MSRSRNFDHFSEGVHRLARRTTSAAAAARGDAVWHRLGDGNMLASRSPRGFEAFVSEIFREIDEELRRDNLMKLWRLYGRYVIAAAVVVLAIALGVVAWRNHQLSERQARSVRYAAAMALMRQGKDADAAKIFDSVAQDGGGYGRLADFEAADLAAKSGDRKAAIAAYDRIAASSDVDQEFRDVATLLSVMNSLGDADPQAEIGRLKPLTDTGNPWRATALELTAAAQLQAGNRAAALDIYKQLADDLSAPEGVRGRAAELASALKP
jgi:hypothetical protein